MITSFLVGCVVGAVGGFVHDVLHARRMHRARLEHLRTDRWSQP